MTFTTHSESETRLAGRRLAEELTEPRIILLYGQLGAGKTAFTRGLAEGLGLVEGDLVHSPTFSLVNEYETPRGKLHHLDLYRLDTRREQDSIGLEEFLEGDRFVVIEWAEKLHRTVDIPIRVRFMVGEGDERRIEVEDRGSSPRNPQEIPGWTP